jgi:DNA-binding transcriptional LysR family regulator
MDRLSDMNAFATAVREGSFAGAAKVMRVSAQRVGKQVAGLERRLGAQLLVRTTRSQSLTEVGRRYYERCCIVLDEATAADALVAEYGAEPRGELVLSAPCTFGTLRLVPFLQDYLSRYPGVSIKLDLNDRNVDLINGGFDAAIRIGELEVSSLMVRHLETFRLAACASPSYLAAHGVPAAPQDLLRHDCLVYTYVLKAPLTKWEFERDGRTEIVDVGGRLWVNDGRAAIAAALSGQGIVLQDGNILQVEVERGHLVHLLPEWRGPARDVSLVYPANRHMPQKLRTFIEEFTAYLKTTRREAEAACHKIVRERRTSRRGVVDHRSAERETKGKGN